VTIQRRLYGHATNVEIRPLDPDKAVQAAADLLGEIVIFSVDIQNGQYFITMQTTTLST
jgi:hypothetical protein